MEWKLFFGDGADSCSFEKGKALFDFSPSPTKETMSVLGPAWGTAAGPALPSDWDLNSRVRKPHSVSVGKQQCKDSRCTGRPPCSPVSEPNLKTVGLNCSENTDLCVASAAKDLLQNCRDSEVPIFLSSLLLKQWPSRTPEVAAIQQGKKMTLWAWLVVAKTVNCVTEWTLL